MRTMSPGSIPARRSSASIPSRARSRWKRSADSSTSKFVWAAIRSIRLPRTRNASPSRLDHEPVAHAPRCGGRRRRPARAARRARSAGRQDCREAARELVDPLARRPRRSPRRPGRRASRAARNAGHAASRRRQVQLVEGDERSACRGAPGRGPRARRGSRRGPSPGRAPAPSTTWTRIRVRSTWRRNAWPEAGARRWRPRSAPGRRRSSAGARPRSPRSITPRFGSSVVNG